MTSVREERPGDEEAIRRVNELAFGRPAEADLVDALRRAGAATLSLVAEHEALVAGHVLLSPVEIERGADRWRALGLAPLAVLPTHQRRGIGSALVRAGIERLRGVADRHGAIVLLGAPAYYRRFGFEPASRFGLRCTFEGAGDAFMALELAPGFLGRGAGVVRYRPEFDAV